MKRVHGDVDKALNAAGGAAACNNDAAIGVDSALYGHIGKAEQTALYTGRYPDFGHPYQAAPVDPQLSPGKMEFIISTHEADQDQHGAERLTDHGGQRYTGHIHPARYDKEQIQRHIYYAADGQENQGATGIAACPKSGGSVVVEHNSGSARKIDI